MVAVKDHNVHVPRARGRPSTARGDLDHARHDLGAGFYDWACFSAQQAAQKAVKAVFQRLGAEAWGHSVADLLEEFPGAVTRARKPSDW